MRKKRIALKELEDNCEFFRKNGFEVGTKGIGVTTAIADKNAIFAGDYEEITHRDKLFTSQL